MIIIRKSDQRGLTKIAWLHSLHTFSFDQYYDLAFMHFGSLRVINDAELLLFDLPDQLS